jgi:hypothetical protein
MVVPVRALVFRLHQALATVLPTTSPVLTRVSAPLALICSLRVPARMAVRLVVRLLISLPRLRMLRSRLFVLATTLLTLAMSRTPQPPAVWPLHIAHLLSISALMRPVICLLALPPLALLLALLPLAFLLAPLAFLLARLPLATLLMVPLPVTPLAAPPVLSRMAPTTRVVAALL